LQRLRRRASGLGRRRRRLSTDCGRAGRGCWRRRSASSRRRSWTAARGRRAGLAALPFVAPLISRGGDRRGGHSDATKSTAERREAPDQVPVALLSDSPALWRSDVCDIA